MGSFIIPSKMLHFHCLLATTIFIVSSSANTEIFIRKSCEVTLYPKLCFSSLSPYASSIQNSPLKLVDASLTVTLKAAESTSDAVSKLSNRRNLAPREAQAMTDCVENIRDSVDEIRESLAAMENLEGPEFVTKMKNVMTWVSAALTDEDTCMDGFQGNGPNGKIKDTIRKYIVNLAQLTSNALALIKNLPST